MTLALLGLTESSITRCALFAALSLLRPLRLSFAPPFSSLLPPLPLFCFLLCFSSPLLSDCVSFSFRHVHIRSQAAEQSARFQECGASQPVPGSTNSRVLASPSVWVVYQVICFITRKKIRIRDFCKSSRIFVSYCIFFVDRRLLPKAWAWVCLSLLAFLREVGPPTLFELFELQFLKTRCTVVYRSPLAARNLLLRA